MKFSLWKTYFNSCCLRLPLIGMLHLKFSCCSCPKCYSFNLSECNSHQEPDDALALQATARTQETVLSPVLVLFITWFLFNWENLTFQSLVFIAKKIKYFQNLYMAWKFQERKKEISKMFLRVVGGGEGEWRNVAKGKVSFNLFYITLFFFFHYFMTFE